MPLWPSKQRDMTRTNDDQDLMTPIWVTRPQLVNENLINRLNLKAVFQPIIDTLYNVTFDPFHKGFMGS